MATYKVGQAPWETEKQSFAVGSAPWETQAPVEEPKQDVMHKAGSVLDMIFGGGKIGDYIGTKAGYAMASDEEKKFYDQSTPTKGQLLGSGLQAASNFMPVGKIAGVASNVLGKVGLETGSKFLGKVASGGITGLSFDTASNLQEGKTGADALTPGLGTALGGAIPLVGPATKGIARLGSESLGVTTGTGHGAIKELFNASAKGGEAKKAALEAMRGNTTPEQVVQEAKDALTTIKQSRQKAYTQSLSRLKENTVEQDISPVVDAVKTNLEKFGVTIAENGAIDFSRSPIRFNTQAQNDITQIVETMKDFGSNPGDKTVIGLDSLKRAFSDLYTPSGEARAFVQSVKNSVRDILGKVPGYDDMSKNYEEKSILINDITKALSLGDKSNIDTAFKKLTTVLRTNNEERKVLVEELNAITGGKLIPTIAGQQMSELLPRGIARQIEGFGALGSAMAGFGVPLLQMALFASPRVVGEMINALGIGARATSKVLDALGIKGLVAPGDYLLNTKAGKALSSSVGNSAKKPSLGMSISSDFDVRIQALNTKEKELITKRNSLIKSGNSENSSVVRQIDKLLTEISKQRQR